MNNLHFIASYACVRTFVMLPQYRVHEGNLMDTKWKLLKNRSQLHIRGISLLNEIIFKLGNLNVYGYSVNMSHSTAQLFNTLKAYQKL